MPVEQIAENLSARFERYTGQAIGIDRQECKSLAGVSIVKNYFNSAADLNIAITQTTALVMSVLRKLPPGIHPPLTHSVISAQAGNHFGWMCPVLFSYYGFEMTQGWVMRNKYELNNVASSHHAS